VVEKMNTFNIRELCRMVDYNPLTGFMIWKIRMSNRVKIGMPAFAAKKDSGHLHGFICRVPLQAHRVAWAIHNGEWPEGCIDHINGIRDDNRAVNLRVVTKRKNALNRRPNRVKLTGLPHGVSKKSNGRFLAQIQKNKINHHLGYFGTADEASIAYQAAKIEFEFCENHGLKALISEAGK